MEFSRAQMSEVELAVGGEDLPEVHEFSFWCCIGAISVAMMFLAQNWGAFCQGLRVSLAGAVMHFNEEGNTAVFRRNSESKLLQAQSSLSFTLRNSEQQ